MRNSTRPALTKRVHSGFTRIQHFHEVVAKSLPLPFTVRENSQPPVKPLTGSSRSAIILKVSLSFRLLWERFNRLARLHTCVRKFGQSDTARNRTHPHPC